MIRLIIFVSILILLPNLTFAKMNYFSEGLKYFKNKEFDKAKFKFEQDIVFNPKNEKAYLYLSKIFNSRENKDLEEKNLKTVILLNPRNEEATYNLAKLKLESSDFKGSKELIDKLLIFCKEYCKKSQDLKIKIVNSLKK
ncbi:MAG: hypothetical protein CBD26_03995 [Candidatus Pelagibacter sp. TMED166]|nr:MAG: hypothetical protein CBD26_03995 [Candidatus Pelagibacter sp. TMED166]|tara:strand:+ start:1323 stop:1742 length:420 start_codon:yes stop_codon:yes gene_type:complete